MGAWRTDADLTNEGRLLTGTSSPRGCPERSRSIATIHAALEAGVTLIDTADAYHLGPNDIGHNESLIAEALAPYGGLLLATLPPSPGQRLNWGAHSRAK